eukprot:3744437-Pleurochrysis_carterae.AAC.1
MERRNGQTIRTDKTTGRHTERNAQPKRSRALGQTKRQQHGRTGEHEETEKSTEAETPATR